MLKLIPEATRAVFMVDIHRSLSSDTVQNALKDEKAKQKYDEFVKMAGIDPMKDVYILALAVAGPDASGNRDGAAVVNLRYNKADLLARIRAQAKDLTEESYNGVTIFAGPGMPGPRKKSPCGAFLDDSNIVLGSDKFVRAVIDVYQKKAASIDKSPEMKKLLKSVNTSANFWGAVVIPQEIIKAQAEKNPMLKDLVGLVGLTLSLDYANKTLVTEIQGLGGTAEQNKSLADKLTGLKAMGSLAGDKEPVIADLLKTIEISSGSNNVKIYSAIPSELLDKVQKTFQDKLGGLVQVNPLAPKEEKKEEKKAGAEVKK
jgi:hypothetical protein